jgi:catechol 2,3-dioxygenase-like lactoylglutathione lyase family enzyme
MFNTVNHTGLTVSSVEESLKFYRDTLGLKHEEARSGEWSGAFLSHLTGYEGTRLRIEMVQCEDGSRIQLEQFVNPVLEKEEVEWGQPGSWHLCVEVSDVFAVLEEVKKNGYRIVSNPPEPVPLPEESIHYGGYFLGVLDPDGHVIELLQPPAQYREQYS